MMVGAGNILLPAPKIDSLYYGNQTADIRTCIFLNTYIYSSVNCGI